MISLFIYASRMDRNGQIGYLAGPMIRDLLEGAVFHSILWISHLSRRLGKIVPTAKSLEAA